MDFFEHMDIEEEIRFETENTWDQLFDTYQTKIEQCSSFQVEMNSIHRNSYGTPRAQVSLEKCFARDTIHLEVEHRDPSHQ